MADAASVRERIIASVFPRKNASGATESYVSHIKIWEDTEDGTEKPRYIILAQADNGTASIHKSKLNANGTFSVGKTWSISELRAIEALNQHAFTITLARTYRWQTEDPRAQVEFLTALIRLFRAISGGAAQLRIIGFRDPDQVSNGVRPSIQNNSEVNRDGVATTSLARIPAQAAVTQTPPRAYNDLPRSASPALSSSSRPARTAPGLPRSRPASPPANDASLMYTADRTVAATPNRRAPSPATSQIGSGGGSRRPRGFSNAQSTNRPPLPSQPQVPVISAPVPIQPHGQPKVPSEYDAIHSSQVSPPSLEIPSTSYGSASLAAPSPSDYNGLSPRPDSTSPAPSIRSRKTSARSRPDLIDVSDSRRPEHGARISFFDPANKAALDRLVARNFGEIGQGEDEGGIDVEEEGAVQATLMSVEEMLEGYEWAGEDLVGRRARGPAEQVESRLTEELMALDKANVYSFLESDDRVGAVLEYLDKAIGELDNMDMLLSSYKISMNTVNEDISFIQGQNRGLQVQTQNQKALLSEVERLLQTVHVDQEDLILLVRGNLDGIDNIQHLEKAAAELYKALQAGRDRDMAATMERLNEYQTHNGQFCRRLLDYLSMKFNAEGALLLKGNDGLSQDVRGRPTLASHSNMENVLGRYLGLLLYLKEMDESTYAKLAANYFSAASDIHSKQIKALMLAYTALIRDTSAEEVEGASSTTPTNASFRTGGIRRAGTLMKNQLKHARDKDKQKQSHDGGISAAEAFADILERIAPQVYKEEDWIAEFLQANDLSFTFADYMNLENYYKRQAARQTGLSAATTKLIRGGMDLIFMFLPAELKVWIDNALAKDSLQIIGIIASLERFLLDAEERGNAFLVNLLEKQQVRLKSLFNAHVNEQLKQIEQTKVTNKKRNGVSPFIYSFPVYISRVEAQLVGANTLPIRANMDEVYDKLVSKMFDSLRQMAKMNGEDEDKGQLNYHVILIENMHHFVAEMTAVQLGSVVSFTKRAEALYNENLNSYIRLVLRRPFAKIIDYFEGVERLLKTTAPTEVANNSSYNKSALKKVTKDFDNKDVRKHIDSLFKRVEKHFTEASEKATDEKGGIIPPGTVLVGVWRACEEELLRMTEQFKQLISQCYGDSGVNLEYTTTDVQNAFKRHRVGV